MRKMIRYAEYGLRILLTLTGIAGVLLFIFPRVAGCTPRIVVSGSMEPAVPVGSITYTCPDIPPEQIETGDVIAYELKNGIAVLHRVVKKDAEKEIWVTQGDANKTGSILEKWYFMCRMRGMWRTGCKKRRFCFWQWQQLFYC